MVDTAAPPPVTSLSPLDGLDTALMVYTTAVMPPRSAPAAGVAVVRDQIHAEGMGVIYEIPRPARGDHLRGPERRGIVRACIEQTVLRAPEASILVDAALYGGKDPKRATQALDPSWVTLQHQMGLPWALTDSGLIEEDHLANTQAILQATMALIRAGHERVIAVLPLGEGWIPHADAIADLIQRHQIPVAIALTDQKDPLAKKGALEALIRLHSTEVASLQLRADGLGLLSQSIAGIAIGDSTGRRHIFPSHTMEGFGNKPKPAAFLPNLLDFFTLERIIRLRESEPMNPALQCSCATCSQYGWDRILTDQSGSLAARHSIAALAQTARTLYPAGSLAADRERAWDEAVEAASICYAGIGLPGWIPKRQFQAWTARRRARVTT